MIDFLTENRGPFVIAAFVVVLAAVLYLLRDREETQPRARLRTPVQDPIARLRTTRLHIPRATRRQLNTAARLLNANNQLLCECVVRNISSTGAMLQIERDMTLPNEIRLAMEDGSILALSIAWRSRYNLGVRIQKQVRSAMYAEEKAAPLPLPEDLRISRSSLLQSAAANPPAASAPYTCQTEILERDRTRREQTDSRRFRRAVPAYASPHPKRASPDHAKPSTILRATPEYQTK